VEILKIIDIKTSLITVPLKKPFKTALRTAYSIENVLVEVVTDSGNTGYGEAPPTGVITGDTTLGIIGAIKENIKPQLTGLKIENIEEIMIKLNNSIVRNTSAKAAVDIAIYDLYGQLYNASIYKLFGAYKKEIITDLTISVNSPKEMAKDSLDAVDSGYNILKIKVGKDAKIDFQRIKAIRKVVGSKIKLRIDANQGWSCKEAINILRKMEDAGLDIEIVEQPVRADDIEGLKKITDNVYIPVVADETVFSPHDALNVMQKRAVDMINIKLMKTGGLYNALKICSMAETYGIKCMIGSMLETKISVTAAAHLAAAKSVITKVDLDSPMLCTYDPVSGGILYNNCKITINEDPGFGFGKIDPVALK